MPKSVIIINREVVVLKRNSLIVCLIMDFVGYLSFTLPVLGELTDLVWAPFSALVFYLLFGGKKGAIGAVFNFVEELSPGLDFIPTFTLMWIFRKLTAEKKSATILKTATT
jgi:hypothetical protein